MGYPDEVEDWIHEELDSRFGDHWTFEDYERVVEELPESVSRADIKQIVKKIE